jgi:hypothetical protein
MAAPSYTARQTPAGKKLKSGWRTLITLSADPNIEFHEVECKPLSYSVALIDDTTQHSVRYEQQSCETLIKSGNMELTVEYDPVCNQSIRAQLGVHQTISILYPDLATEAFFGAVVEWNPEPLKRGEKPKASVVIAHLGQDANCIEQGPVYVAGPGTSTC